MEAHTIITVVFCTLGAIVYNLMMEYIFKFFFGIKNKIMRNCFVILLNVGPIFIGKDLIGNILFSISSILLIVSIIKELKSKKEIKVIQE